MLDNKRFFKKPKIDGYLYIPFLKDELSTHFLMQAFNFQELSARQGKHFEIIRYNHFDFSGLEKFSKVYVLGHGTDLELGKSSYRLSFKTYNLLKNIPFEDWPFTISSKEAFITIDELAKRMISDNLLAADQINIKLWFCDPAEKAHFLAKRFAKYLAKSNHNFEIDYYPGYELFTPKQYNGEQHKFTSKNDKKKLIRSSTIQKSIYTNGKQNYHPDYDFLSKKNLLLNNLKIKTFFSEPINSKHKLPAKNSNIADITSIVIQF